MAVLTKTDAQTLIATYQNRLETRVNTWLTNRAQSGHLGGVFTYTAEDTGPQAQAVRQALVDAGWTVVVDTTARTVTIS